MYREQFLVLESREPYNLAEAFDRKGVSSYALIDDDADFFGEHAEVWRYTLKEQPYFCLNKLTPPYRLYFYGGQKGLITSATDVRNWAEDDELKKQQALA